MFEGTAKFARRAAAKAVAALDQAFITVIEVEGLGSKKAVSSVPHARRMELLLDVARTYGVPAHFATPDSFFRVPALISPREMRLVPASAGGPMQRDIAWESAFTPFHEGVRAKFASRVNNRTAHARLLSTGSQKPWVVLVHGYMGGQWAFEARQWRVSGLLRAGLNVALFVLPFHARRSDGMGRAPVWPSADPRFNNEAFAQAIFDLRALTQYLYAEGAPHVGAMGMSLGGFTTSLLATADPTLAFAAPVIPLASLADFARARGRLGTNEAEAALEHAALEQATRVVSPFARPLLVPKSRVLIVAAEGDRITPVAHARKIAEHFGAEVRLMQGGHLLQLDRREGLRAVIAMLRREGILRATAKAS